MRRLIFTNINYECGVTFTNSQPSLRCVCVMQKCKPVKGIYIWACVGIHSINTNPCTLNTNTCNTQNHAHTRNDIPLLHTRTQFKCGVATTTSQSKLRMRTWICKNVRLTTNACFTYSCMVSTPWAATLWWRRLSVT